MALKARFQKKDVSVKTLQDKEEKLAKSQLSLIKKKKTESPLLPSMILESHDGDYDGRKLACYHKINEFYQNNSYGLFHLMKGMLDIICHGVQAEGGSLWIIEDDKQTLTCKVANGEGSEKLSGFAVEIGQGIVGWVAENKRSTIVYDAKKDERFIGKKNNEFNTQSLVASPLLYNNEIIGVIEVVNTTSSDNGHYTDSDKAFLEDLATLAAMHIKTSRLIKKQDDVLRRMHTFSELHELFSSTIDLDQLLKVVLSKAISLLKSEVGSIWLVEESGEGVTCAYADGPTKDKVLGVKLKRGTGIIGSIIESKKPQIVADCSKDDRFSSVVDKKTNFKTRSIITAPLVVKGECIGAIQIINKKGQSALFDEADLELLNLFASSSAMYIKNARLFSSEKKAKDLSSLIEISREITSTLDLDSILTSLVNLSSNLIPFDEAGVSVMGLRDQLALRSISGQYDVDKDNNKYKKLEDIHKEVSELDQPFLYIPQLEQCPQQFSLLKEYLQENEIQSFWVSILKDDQGVVGVYSLESEEEFLISDSRKELLSILTGQATVALRNAQLYNTIPNAQVLKNYQDKILKTMVNITKQSKKFYQKLAMVTFAIIGIMFIPVPHHVGADIEILPRNHIMNAEVSSLVNNVYVKEGDFVKKGDVLIELDISQSLIEQKNKEYQQLKVKTEMLKLKEEQRIADYKIKEAEYLSLEQEIKLLQRKIHASNIKSPVNGVILSENLDELVGMPVNFGQELIKIGNQDELFVQFKVKEEDVMFVEPQQEVVFKVYGHPTESFEDYKVISVAGEGRQVLESDPNIYYLARAKVSAKQGNKEDYHILRPGMTGRGRITTEWLSLGKRLFRNFYNLIIMEFLF